MLAAAVMLLTGCAKTGGATDGCEWTRYILVSGKDVLTEGTAQQILAHNLARQSVCRASPTSAGASR